MTDVDYHIREVMGRGAGWKQSEHCRWPVLEVHALDYHGGPVGTHMIVHSAKTDAWYRLYVEAGATIGLDPDALGTIGLPEHLSAVGAATEAEQLARGAS